MVAGYTGFDKRLKYLFDNATEVSATALYNSGTLLGSITVDGQTVNIYSPSGGGSIVTYSEGLQSGTLVGTLTIDGVSHNLYCTSVEANPQGQATGVLSTLGIGGTVYEIQGGGGGTVGVVVEELYSRTSYPTPAPSSSGKVRTYTMAHSIDDYDAIVVYAWTYASTSGRESLGHILIFKDDYYLKPTTDVSKPWTFLINGSYPGGERTLYMSFTDNTTLKTITYLSETGNEPTVYKVYGLKFGSAIHTYSTTEQIIGEWIDGNILYEKTVVTGGSVPTGATEINRISMTGYDVLQYTK